MLRDMRYFPRSCEPAYWQGWPLDMPSSGENSPNPDQGGGHGPTDASPGGSASSKSPNSKRVEGKRCGVCGDRALGYNFNAITCESCKAFFRRNALKNKEYRCPFNDECEVTAVTRRFCQRCRLRKCFEIGMKKEWIMTDEEKKKKRKKIEENRARKVGDAESSSPGGVTSPVSTEGEPSLLSQKAEDTEGDSNEGSEEAVGRGGSGSTGTELPTLPPKQAAGAMSKPKAVVVGRVREHESEAKVRRSSHQTDVHTPKETHPAFKLEDQASTHLLQGHSNPFHRYPSQILVTSVKGLPPQQPLSYQLPQVPPLQPAASEATSGSLVAGLLRASSQGSAEDDSLMPPLEELGCQEGEESFKAEVLSVKSETQDEPTEEGPSTFLASMEFGHSPPPPSSVWSCPTSISSPGGAEPLPSSHGNRGLAHSPHNSTFEFSIREALAIIQPGCKNKSPSSTTSNVMESIMNTAISAEYSAFGLLTSSRSSSSSSSSSSELNQAETLKINELLDASKGLNIPLCEEPNYKDLPNPSLINVINLTEIAIRRFIKMAKKISAFKTFCQEDQIALLKAGCTEMMILRSVSAYDPDKDVWKIQQDHERFKNIKLKVLKAASGNVYEEHKRFMLSFQPEWRQDTMIIALLAAIALFTPERANVIHPEAVRHEQSSYLFLLKRYLECKYGGCVGKTNYMKLLEIIGNLHILNEDHVRVFLEVNPQEVEPLLIEIFDLKQS